MRIIALAFAWIMQSQYSWSAESAVSVTCDDEIFEREPSGVSSKVYPLLQDFDPDTDIALFDWDETIAGKQPVNGDVREVRSRKTLALFSQLRADNPGRVFIYSNGNAFIFDRLPDGNPVLGVETPHVPSGLDGIEVLITDGIPHYSDDGQRISKLNTTSRFFYFPAFHAFYIPKIGPNTRIISKIPPEHLKGHYIGEILKVLGFSPEKPLRRVYFVDNDAIIIDGMRSAIEKLIKEGIVQEPLQSAHVPFFDDVR